MSSETFFAELSRILAKEGIETAQIENGRLPILLDGQPIGRVEPGGMLCRMTGDSDTPEATELYFSVAPFSEMVQEYLTAMETAPPLHADGLDEDFKLLAEFNGTVLAGREMERGYGMKFVTWDWSYGKTGLYQGHYHLDAYAAAKEDFAVRAGLIQKGRQFTDEQMTDIYRCLHDTLDGCYEPTREQEKSLKSIAEQIESAVPDVQERVRQSEDIQMEPYQSM